MLIQSQQNGKKIARALNSHLPAVWREKPPSCSQGSTDIIQDYWQICVAAPSIACSRPIEHRHIHPHAQLQESPKWGLREAAAAGMKEETQADAAKTYHYLKKTQNNQGTYCHPMDLVPALCGEWTLHQITLRKYLFIIITSLGKQADL